MDMTQSIEPRSDQWNADDLIAGPVTVTIREVIKGAAEQPFDFKLVESERVYRPSKTSRRVIVAAWGAEAASYTGRRLTLYREPSITFAGKVVGGIRISAMSHIDGPLEVMAQTTRGKRETFVVQPLPAIAAPAPREVESRAAPGQIAAEPVAGLGVSGGLQIDSVEAATRVIRAMSDDQVKKLKTLLASDATTKTALAASLYDQRATHYAESVHHELEEMEA